MRALSKAPPCVRLAVALALVVGLAAGCGPKKPLRIAVTVPSPSGIPGIDPPTEMSPHPNISWAVERVNAAGGAAGHMLSLEFFDWSAGTQGNEGERARATALATDENYTAVIGPGSSTVLLAVADLFVAAKKPIVSPMSAAADVLRAYGGQGAVWRTRQSDIAQTELLVHIARELNAKQIALISTLDSGGATFFSWFGFFAKELDYPDDAVNIAAIDPSAPCDDAVTAALTKKPEVVFVAAGDPMALECIGHRLATLPMRPRVVFADTGFDPRALVKIMGSENFEGISASGDEAFEAAFKARFPMIDPAPHGAAEFDAVLLLAYGLAVSDGHGGQELLDGIKAAVDGREAGPTTWDDAGVAKTLSALRSGKRPLLHGATGNLVYEPGLYVDPIASTLSHWVVRNGQVMYDHRYFTGDKGFLTSGGVLVPASAEHGSVIADSTWAPAATRTDTWALVVALSSGWDNYRHQADALRQYQTLRAGGVPDDHIILILADDLAGAAGNPLPGTVRNVPGGPNLRAGAAVDYKLDLGASAILDILAGKASNATPDVLKTTASSDLYVYLVGHGGSSGIAIGANTTADGLKGEGATISPAALRDTLCALSAAKKFRRAFVVVESCYSGVFGEAGYNGIEAGCKVNNGGGGGDTEPLDGVVLMTAANSKEVSYAGRYDPTVGAWISDAFSDQVATRLASTPTINLAGLYAEVYLRVAGSHSSLWNSAHAGRITTIEAREFFTK